MTDHEEWTEARLLALIRDQVTEATSLEYKAADALRHDKSNSKDERLEEVTRDISAMANGAGGVIIYGISEKNHLPQPLDAGFDPSEVKHEWIENIANSNIQPKIRGLRIRRVPLSNTHPGREALVVEVPASDTAHQAKDLLYYQRQEFSRPAMKDYQIRDVMFRVKHPRVALVVDVGSPAPDQPDLFNQGLSVEGLTFRLRNDATTRAKDFLVEVTIPTVYIESTAYPGVVSTLGSLRDLAGVSLRSGSVVLASGRKALVTHLVFEKHNAALFPGQEILLFSRGKGVPLVHLYIPNFLSGEVPDAFVHWRIFADDAPPTEGQIVVRDGLPAGGRMPIREK